MFALEWIIPWDPILIPILIPLVFIRKRLSFIEPSPCISCALWFKCNISDQSLLVLQMLEIPS